MPDLMIEHIRTCKQNLFFSTKIKGSSGKTYDVTYCETPRGPYQYGWHCTCPDFVFNKNHNCKHIKKAKDLKCDWNWEAWMGSHAEPNPDKTCPKCGGETTVIRVGI